MIGLAEFCEKAGFQNALSERCHEYLVEKESVGVQVQKPMGMLLRFLRMCLANGEPLDHASKSAVERWNEKDMFQVWGIIEKTKQHFFRHQRANTTFHTQFTMHGGRRFTMQGYLTVGKEKVRESMTYVTLSRFIVCRSGLRLARI